MVDLLSIFIHSSRFTSPFFKGDSPLKKGEEVKRMNHPSKGEWDFARYTLAKIYYPPSFYPQKNIKNPHKYFYFAKIEIIFSGS
jgi:hypothetical protein